MPEKIYSFNGKDMYTDQRCSEIITGTFSNQF